MNRRSKSSGVGQPLGENFREVIDELIEKRMAELEAGNQDNFQHRQQFKFAEKYLREDIEKRLDAYEDHCSQYRAHHNMRPFHWAHETTDRVVAAMSRAPLPKIRKLKE